MSTPSITINKDALTNDTIVLMKDKNIARLPVINEAGGVLGIVSLRTLIGRAEQINSISAFPHILLQFIPEVSFVPAR